MAKTRTILVREIIITIEPTLSYPMLVIITDEQLLSPKQVCQTCLMASRGGLPRWQQGKLNCARAVIDNSSENQAAVYECQMGFRVAHIN